MNLCPVHFLIEFLNKMELSAKHDSWKLTLENDGSNATLNNKMLEIVSIFKASTPAAECIQNVRENPGFAALAVDHFQTVVLLHNVYILGPSLRIPEQKVLSLSGIGRSANCLRLPESVFDSDLSIDSPGWADLKRATSAEEITSLVVPENATKQRFKGIIMVPPLVVTAFLSSESTTAADLIPVLSKAFQSYDREVDADHQKACEHLRIVLFYLWAASKNLVPPSVMVIDRSPEGLDWSATLHLKHIAPIIVATAPSAPISVEYDASTNETGAGPNNVFGNIADTLKLLTEASCKDMLKDSTSSKPTKESSATETMPSQKNFALL